MQATSICIGVDVSKAELVICTAGQRTRSLPNDKPHIKSWLRTVPKEALMAMESTGCYHMLLAQLALDAGLKVYVLNARDVFFYARALGTRAKADRVDAAVIARYLGEHHARLHPWRPGSPIQRQVQQLLRAQAKLAAQRAAMQQSVKGIEQCGDALDRLNAAFKDALMAMERQVHQLINSDERMANGYRRLLSITGIGPQTGALLATLFSRLGFANADALVAYSGLDPRPNDSGSRHGRRRLSKKGPALLRRQLYLAAMSAGRSKALEPIYRALRARGFATTEATVILGRKLLRVAWAIWNSGQIFDPNRLVPHAA